MKEKRKERGKKLSNERCMHVDMRTSFVKNLSDWKQKNKTRRRRTETNNKKSETSFFCAKIQNHN